MKNRLYKVATLACCTALVSIHPALADDGAGAQAHSERLLSSDGTPYLCKPTGKTINSRPVRECLRESTVAKSVFGAGTAGGIGLSGIGGGMAILGAIASDMESSPATTTTRRWKR